MKTHPAIRAALAMIVMLTAAVFKLGGYYCGLFTLLALGLLYAVMYHQQMTAEISSTREFTRKMKKMMGPPHYKHRCPYD